MLAVGVDAAAEGVPVLERVAVARRDPGREAAVLVEGDNLRAVRLRDGGSRVGRAVVDDQEVGLRELLPQFLEDRGQVLLFVPGREKDEGVRVGADPGRLVAA
jgi:hypothetical protein